MLEYADAPVVRTARLRPANALARAYRLGDGRLIGYAEYGDPDGAPVLALHGTPGSRLMFKLADRAAAARRLRLIAPDRPGYGLSSPRALRGFSTWTEDAVALADALGIDRFAIAGVSGGAPYAAACAARLGDRVSALALVSPLGPLAEGGPVFALSPAHSLIFLRLGRLPWANALTFMAMRLALGRTPELCHAGLARRAARSDRAALLRPEIKASLLESMYEGLKPGVSGAMEDLRLFGAAWDFALTDIVAPACVWQGTCDRSVPAAAAAHLAAAIPACELRPCDGAGHYWMFEHFAEVIAWIAARAPAPAS